MSSIPPAAGEHQFCPDPSVHEKHNRLSEAASTAALYVTQHHDRSQTPQSGRESVLGPDGKLSSKSAATSLKYAKAQDLPSFPSRGSNMGSASAAAMLAKDYKMKELWEPSASSAGSKAAMQAHKTGGKVDLWEPSASSAGNSAAVLAMRNTGLSPQIDRGYTAGGRNNSLLAATKSHNQGRQRAGSVPVPAPSAYPDSHNSAFNALNAATASHRTSSRISPPVSRDGWNSEANQAARITHIGNHMKPEMFSEHPPVAPEVEEQKYNAALRASAVSMAKQMYDFKEVRRLESESAAAEAGAGTAHRRNPSLPVQPDLRQEAVRYIHLQDAAHKLAQERIAKVDQEFSAGKYREYWGYQNHQTKQSRLSMRGRRKRANSEGAHDADSSDDELQARRIRQQMSQLSSGIDNVDGKKKEDDRARLLAAAEKRVHDRLRNMDQEVYLNKGKVSQAMMDEWEAKAREKAEQERNERERHPGQVNIGGGRFMAQSEIEAIAAARLKPTLDRIDDTAQKRRAQDEKIAAQKDREQTERMNEKMKEQEQKAEFKRIREIDKLAAQKEKEDRKAAKKTEREDAKVRKSEEKRKSREVRREEIAAVTGGAVLAEVAAGVQRDSGEHYNDLKEKRTSRGMFGRLANKLKKRGDDDDAQEAPSTVETTKQEPIILAPGTEAIASDRTETTHEPTDAATAADAHTAEATPIIAAAVVTAPAIEVTEEPHEQHDIINDIEESSTDEDEVDSAPLAALVSREYNDPTASQGISLAKPSLERHISTIAHSDDDSDDELYRNDDDDEDEAFEFRDPVSPLTEQEANAPLAEVTSATRTTSAAGAATAVVIAASAVSGVETFEKEDTTVSQPVLPTSQTNAAEVMTKSPPQQKEYKGKESKGIKGFIGKFTKRQSKADKNPGSFASGERKSYVAEEKPAADAEAKATSIEANRSTSSFQRHEQEPQDPDDVSSSGADEDDVARGRTGRLARKLGLKRNAEAEDPVASGPVKDVSPSSGKNDDEQFEEARDHFDEGLAPAPAFAGQLKSASPVRDSRFQEQL